MKQKLKIFATSKWFDLLGVALVIGIAINVIDKIHRKIKQTWKLFWYY